MISELENALRHIAVDRLPWARLVAAILLSAGASTVMIFSMDPDLLAFVGVALASAVVLSLWAALSVYASMQTSTLSLLVAAMSVLFCIITPFAAIPDVMLRVILPYDEFEYTFACWLVGVVMLYAGSFYVLRRRRNGISLRVRTQTLVVACVALIALLPMRWPMIIRYHIQSLVIDADVFSDAGVQWTPAAIHYPQWITAPAVRRAWTQGGENAYQVFPMIRLRRFFSDEELVAMIVDPKLRERAIFALYWHNKELTKKTTRSLDLGMCRRLPGEILFEWMSRCSQADFDFMMNDQCQLNMKIEAVYTSTRYELILQSKAPYSKQFLHYAASHMLLSNSPERRAEVFRIWNPPLGQCYDPAVHSSVATQHRLQSIFMDLHYDAHAIFRPALKDSEASVRHAALSKLIRLFEQIPDFPELLGLADSASMSDEELDRACWVASSFLSWHRRPSR